MEEVEQPMLISDNSFYNVVCSDILMSESSLDHFHDGVSVDIKDEWNDNALALRPIFDQFYWKKM